MEELTIFELDLDWFTCGILKHIPLDESTVIFAGGLLFDAYYAYVHQTKSTYDLEELKDIDLFLMGPEEKKISIVKTIIENLQLAYGESNVVVGVDRAVITICIVGLPRMVQIICTNYEKAEQVIDNFDMAHVAMYYSNKGFFATPFAKLSVSTKQVLPNPKCGKRAKPARLLKYKSRGMDISQYIKEFPFNVVNFAQIYKKNNERNKYIESKNLSEWSKKATKINDYIIYIMSFLGLRQLKFNKNSLEWTEQIEWSGNFEYLQPKENFLSESNSLKIDRRDDNNFYVAFAHKTPSIISSSRTSELYSDFMCTGKMTHLIKESGGMSDYFYYLIWTVEDPDTIELIKQVVKLCVDDLAVDEKSREFYETCILDSQALTPEERILYNVKNFPHDKYANAELSEKVLSCANLPGLFLFAPIYPEKFILTLFVDDNEESNGKHHYVEIEGVKTEVSKSYAQSLKLDTYLNNLMGTDVCIISKVKNVKTCAKSVKLTEDKRARTCFAIGYIN